MTALTVFHYNDAAVRAQQSDAGEPLFCVNDVCSVLGYSNPRDALRQHVFIEDVVKRDTLTNGGKQALSYVNESGLYSLIFGSKLERARDFKRWVTSEVLPTIRKTGRYEAPASPRSSAQIAPMEQLAMCRMVYEAADLSGNQLALAMDKAYKAKTGESALALGEVRLIAPTQEQLLTATLLGKEIGLSAQAVNKKLAAKGFIVKAHDGWELTAVGKAAGGVYLDVGKKHSNGTPIRQIKWPANIASQLSA